MHDKRQSGFHFLFHAVSCCPLFQGWELCLQDLKYTMLLTAGQREAEDKVSVSSRLFKDCFVKV